jgi:hypothetical protein
MVWEKKEADIIKYYNGNEVNDDILLDFVKFMLKHGFIDVKYEMTEDNINRIMCKCTCVKIEKVNIERESERENENLNLTDEENYRKRKPLIKLWRRR